MLQIKAFRAIDHPDLCESYITGHRRVLEAVGVTKVTSANTEWVEDPLTWVVSVFSTDDNRVVGGARIQKAGGSLRLPIEDAIGDMDARIYDMVQAHVAEGTGELCGLWNSREVAGLGIGSMFLTRAGVSILNQLNMKSLFGLAASYTLKMAMNAGYEIVHELGQDGTFYYPKENLIATALLIPDIDKLGGADPGERDLILQLRDNPVQSRLDIGRQGEIWIDYQLRVQ